MCGAVVTRGYSTAPGAAFAFGKQRAVGLKEFANAASALSIISACGWAVPSSEGYRHTPATVASWQASSNLASRGSLCCLSEGTEYLTK
jgi:hypothetical protein